MTSIGQLKLPDNNNYNLSVPFVIGTGDTAGTWFGKLTGLTAYYDGLLILYKPSVAGASTTTLNLNSIGAKTCYINNTTKLTTHFPVNQPILLTYSASQNNGCWMCINNYWANTNNAVTQTATSTNANYEVLFSSTADNTTRTEGARKNSNLTFNPSTGNLAATKLNGVTIGSSPKFTDTTYESKSASSGGTDVSLVTTGEKYVWNNSQKPIAYINVIGNITANYWSTSGSSYTVTSITDAFGNTLSYSNLWNSNHDMLYDVHLIYKYTPSSGTQNEYTYKWKATRYLYYIATTMVRIDWEWQDDNNRYVMMTTNGMSVSFTRYPLPKNETATSGGTTLSLVTTGDKYNWNNTENRCFPNYWSLFADQNTSNTLKTLDVVSGRKISDFYMLFAIVVRGNYERASAIIPVGRFTDGMWVSLTEVDSAKTQRWYEVKYVDDTHVTVQCSSNATGSEVHIYGLGTNSTY